MTTRHHAMHPRHTDTVRQEDTMAHGQQDISIPLTPLDYPRVRASKVCPLCELDKETGIIVCWPCYRLWNLRHGMSPEIQALLESVEKAR